MSPYHMFDLTLTFDNGPSRATPAVLDLLAAHGVLATFFVVGRLLADGDLRALAERAHAEGHWIGNHSYSHQRSLGDFSDWNESIKEVSDAQEAIGDLAHPDLLFRPFANSAVLDQRVFNPLAIEYLSRQQYTIVLWNAVPGDWKDGDWVARAVELLGQRPWSVMLLHDFPGRAIPGLDTFLERAAKAGARFKQDFPADCVPMVRGEIRMPIQHVM